MIEIGNDDVDRTVFVSASNNPDVSHIAFLHDAVYGSETGLMTSFYLLSRPSRLSYGHRSCISAQRAKLVSLSSAMFSLIKR